MSNSKHTPGPWKFEPIATDFAIYSNQYVVASVTQAARNAKENARLIAAAPDLLESLINLVNLVNELDFSGYDAKGEDPEKWTAQVIAAIQKAGG